MNFFKRKGSEQPETQVEEHNSYKNDKVETSSIDKHQVLDQEHDVESLQHGTKRGLGARHIQMISLGGAIGTGLFLNSGSNVANAGPAGALIAYCVYCIMTCLGEMATFMPVSGSFNHYATRFVEPSLGFALGWNYWFSAVTIAAELAAAARIIAYWEEVMPDAAWSAIFLVATIAINFLSVRVYGELEYWFALIKIVIVIVFIIIAILVAAGAVGGTVHGFKYWSEPGAFVDGAVGTISVLLSAGFSFQGTEIVGITAGEAKNPTKTVPRAIRNTFWRIIVFYICTIFLIGLCIPADDPRLASDDVVTAPFTIVFVNAGIKAGADVINAIVLTSVLSALNSSMYTTSRTVMGLCRDGNGPAIFGKVNSHGSPFCSKAFDWFVSITAVSGFISWCGIAAVHVRFRRAYVRQGRNVDELPYKAFAYPYSGIFASVLCILIILGQGYVSFTPTFDAITFVTCYIGLVPFILCYVGHKIITKGKIVPLEEVDFETGRVTQTDIEKDAVEEEEQTKFRRMLAWII
ncbi:amino acid permease/ SLC12A domain-containing protein [Pilobolus umbonatus]|nr:amino acid permease/ SLC12A domain-containing protein [Pilobolus umbonatus]